MTTVTLAEWDQYLAGHPEANLLQTGAWGELKAGFGWQVERIRQGEAGAQVLFRRLPGGVTVAYLPKGPVGEARHWRALWPAIDRACRRRRALLLKIEPDRSEPLGAEEAEALRDLTPSQPVQPRRTVLVSLAGDEAAWLERMKPKTRYNIRLAERKGVQVRPWADLDGFYAMMRQTAERDGFAIHARDYYRQAYELFHPLGQCELLAAEFEGRPLAALMVFAHGQRAWYLFGASSEEERSRMPTYLLQWEAMRWAKAAGCLAYDLVGVPDEDEATLEREFANRSDGLWGVYRFKRGFGGRVERSVGAWDREYVPLAGRLYRWYSERRRGRAGARGVE